MAGDAHIRAEKPGDEAGIRTVHDTAFGQAAEGEVVDVVRDAGATLLSLVAVLDGRIVGHVLFSPAWIGRRKNEAAALGPLAVLPTFQGKGIGSALVREGLFRLGGMGLSAVVVLGDPHYYGRFGFRRSSSFGLAPTEPWPDEAFQAIELVPRALRRGGKVRYHHAFSGV